MWVCPEVLHTSNSLSLCDLAVVAYSERFVLEVDGSPSNTELGKHSWLEFVVVDLPNQGGVDTRVGGNSTTYNRKVILTWVSRGEWGSLRSCN